MEEYSKQNKRAWEYNAYDFWCRNCSPQERAKSDVQNPIGQLRKYAKYFEKYENVKIANICGSCGKKAVPLAVLGADVTVFDISEDNKRYAEEVVKAANVKIDYQVCDVLEINRNIYADSFDIVFMEGGVLHYFHDINEFMRMMYSLLKKGGKMICSDFHPFTKIIDTLGLQQKTMSYFSTEVFEGEMAHARFFDEEIRKKMPLCSYRKYTVSEIINSVIRNGFTLKQFDEHPAWENERVPGEFTLVAVKA
ncbi:MAG: class I SAM-dependent methyltransferase [Lachnospiraceae bacterium]|nr:class I SAM-dependent methyltransferase [Lachnospiraceae bacterium]